MIRYNLDDDNTFSVRVNQITGTSLTFQLVNMMTNDVFEITGVTGYTYSSYEQVLTFPITFSCLVGDEYRFKIIDGLKSVYNGSIQVFQKERLNKEDYDSENNQYTSMKTDNNFIILE